MTDVVQRECVLGPDISGTYHHYGHLNWWSVDDLFDGEYPRPECPVSQLGSTDEKVGCSRIAERVTDDQGRGAWYCGWHGAFRVFGYPRARERTTTQQTLVADGGELA